jgi:hypothetical protein
LSRPPIRRHRPAQDPFQVCLAEAEGECRLGGLGGVSAPPLVLGKPPPDLDRRGEVRLKRGHGQTAESDEPPGPLDLDRPETEPKLLELRLDSGHELIRFVGGQDAREMLHDLGIGIYRGETLSIVLFPPSK